MSAPSVGTPWSLLPEKLVWANRPAAGDLRSLPDKPAVYILADESGRPIQLATTQSLRRALIARVAEPAAARKRADVAEITRQVHWRALHTAFEARWWYYRLARELYPREYRRMVSFGPAYFLHVNWDRAIPELRVSENVWLEPGEYLGPWPTSRACQSALEGLVDVFDLCRFPERVRQAPQGTRCAYADMGRCDAPCDGGAPLPAYVARCRAAWAFACGATAEWLGAADAKMRTAAREQRFEQAGVLKEQMAFAQRWASTIVPHVRIAADMDEAVLLPATRRRAWKLIGFRAGQISDGPIVPTRQLPGAAVAWLRALAAEAAPAEPVVRMEQTWLWSGLRSARESPVLLLADVGQKAPADLEQAIRTHVEQFRKNAGGGPRSAAVEQLPDFPKGSSHENLRPAGGPEAAAGGSPQPSFRPESTDFI